MARLIYALLAFALGTLVAGFLIRDSSVPLFASIGLSALVLVLILFGTSRRLRRREALEEEQAELAELDIVEIDVEPLAEVSVAESPPSTIEMPAAAPRAAAEPRGRRRSAEAEPSAAAHRQTTTPARRRARSSPAQTAPRSSKVWVIPGRSRYHTRGCRFAKGDQLRAVTEATARRRGYVPCSVCEPSGSAVSD